MRFLQPSPPPICRLPQPISAEKKSRGASPPPSVPQHNCCFAQHKAPARGSRNAQDSDSSATSLAALYGTTAATGPLFGRWAVLPGLGTSQTTHERYDSEHARAMPAPVCTPTLPVGSVASKCGTTGHKKDLLGPHMGPQPRFHADAVLRLA